MPVDGDAIVFLALGDDTLDQSIGTVEINGQEVTQLHNARVAGAADPNDYVEVAVYRLDGVSAGPLTVRMNTTQPTGHSAGCTLLRVSNGMQIIDALEVIGNQGVATTGSLAAGAYAIAVTASSNRPGPLTWTGLTKIFEQDRENTDWYSVAVAENFAGGTVTAAYSGGSTIQEAALVAIALGEE